MNTKEFIALEEQYGAHNYHPLPVVLLTAVVNVSEETGSAAFERFAHSFTLACAQPVAECEDTRDIHRDLLWIALFDHLLQRLPLLAGGLPCLFVGPTDTRVRRVVQERAHRFAQCFRCRGQRLQGQRFDHAAPFT